MTGASRGIGRAIAERLAAAGFSLTLSGRRADSLAEVARGLAGTGVELETVAADMAAEDDVRRLAHRHAERFGALDLLVLCAGFGTSGALAGYPIHRSTVRSRSTCAPRSS